MVVSYKEGKKCRSLGDFFVMPESEEDTYIDDADFAQ